MKEEIKKRIEAFQRGEVPEGYKCENGYVIPNEWDTTNFKRVFSRSTKKNRVGCDNVLTISAQMGLISQRDFYEKDIASDDKSEYYLMKKGDFAYNKSYSAGYDYGAIKRLDKYTEGIVSPLYICMTPQSETNSDFYVQYFEAGRYNREIYRFAQEGARNHGLLNIAVEDFFNGVVAVPSETEQQRIAEILATCDKVIELKQKLIEEKRRQKKWLMQKLLNPDSGVRLPGFEGSKWETSRFGSICTFVNGRAYSQDELLSEGKYPVLRVGNLFTNAGWYYSNMELSPSQYIDTGDLIYAWSASFGPRIWDGGKVIYHYHIWKVQPDSRISKEYLYQYLTYDVALLAKEQQGGTMAHITKDIMEKRLCKFPEVEEQKAIANTLLALKIEVELYEQELVEWQQKKKALMQLLLTGLVRVKV